MRRFLPFLVLAIALAVPVAAQPPKADAPADEPPAHGKGKPWFIDDEKFSENFVEKLSELAKDGKCLARDKLVEKMTPGRKAKLTPAKAGDKALSPEEVY